MTLGNEPERFRVSLGDSKGEVTIVAVHGVGDPVPGSLLGGLEEAITRYWDTHLRRKGPQPSFRSLVETVDGRSLEVRRTVVSGKTVLLVDANWADIGRAPKDWWAQIAYTMKLLVGTVFLAAGGGEDRRFRLFFGQLYALAICLFLPALAALPLISLAAIIPIRWAFILAAATLAGAFGWLAWYLRTFSRMAGIGSALAVILVIAGTGAHLAEVSLMPRPAREARGGSVCLNGFRAAVKWISALVTPPPGLASSG